MKSKGLLQYLAGVLFLALSIYKIVTKEPWEFAMYAVAGAAFITMGLIRDNKFERHRGFMNVLSWILILGAAFLFFFLLRTDAGV